MWKLNKYFYLIIVVVIVLILVLGLVNILGVRHRVAETIAWVITVIEDDGGHDYYIIDIRFRGLYTIKKSINDKVIHLEANMHKSSRRNLCLISQKIMGKLIKSEVAYIITSMSS